MDWSDEWIRWVQLYMTRMDGQKDWAEGLEVESAALRCFRDRDRLPPVFQFKRRLKSGLEKRYHQFDGQQRVMARRSTDMQSGPGSEQRLI